MFLHCSHTDVQTNYNLIGTQFELERLVAQMSRIERLVVHFEIGVVVD